MTEYFIFIEPTFIDKNDGQTNSNAGNVTEALL